MAPRSATPHAPVVRLRTGKQAGEQDHPFSWVITGQPNPNNSSDSLADSNESHQSSSVASVEGDNLAGEHASPTSRLRKTTAAQAEPRIVHADDNLPLRGAQNASARKATLASKGKDVSTVAPTKQKSIVPSAFKFTKRSKSTGTPEPVETSAAMVPPVPTTPSSLRSAPIHARFAKANRESWIQKKGYREVVQGPIIPSRRGAPTLSFITQEPEEVSPLTYMPALSSSSHSDGIKSPSSPERALSPVQRAISPPMRMTTPTSVARNSPQLRVQSPSPSADIEPPLKTSTAIRIMYPKATKPAPHGPLPEPPLPALERAVSPVQRTDSTSPASRAAYKKSGRAVPILPVSGMYQVTVQKREVTIMPPLLKVAPTSYSSVEETELHYAASAPTTPLRGRTELPQRAFTPAPAASTGLRRTPSLPPTRRVNPAGELVRGREHPFPLRPVQRQASAQQLQPAFRVEVEVDDPRINRVGFYMSPSGGASSAMDISSSGMRLDVPRNPRGRSVDPSSRRSGDPPSMYSDVSFGDSIGEEVTSRQLMSELEHDMRRQNLISNVDRLVVQDRRVIA
ncbi:hypothetical protein BKA62DRAFT_668167 [Auriculariales sp. MPI-PUGE-AT-0066]|nr:hypothetical protein BKA62DRAFT_668167 [Auriculariales sp. MPI-PUGE-AT-0066]